MLKLQFDAETKWYSAKLYQDLFGDWILAMSWGSKLSKLGNSKMKVFQSEQEGIKAVEKIKKIRQKHHYSLLP